ncbi:hypothetical protein [Thermoactinospora rubra]|uniref:hypothetical protein n=1 Tax=Thermoactinospora rubra TaxID=1088767 RepID=UPI0011800C08|nr:hypothetical protein [Thermoactinospora rubra]
MAAFGIKLAATKAMLVGVAVGAAVISMTSIAHANTMTGSAGSSSVSSLISVDGSMRAYWRYAGTWGHFECFRRGNQYVAQGNALDYRCDDVGGGRSELWLLVNE